MLVQKHDPDIIIGTESWLSPKINSNEVFPTEDYNVERRDRPNDAHGGVFIATKKDLLTIREVELETDCEIQWCKIDIAGAKTLHIAAYYRPHEGDEASLTELAHSLSRLGPTHTVVIGGDFNFPGWNWKDGKVDKCRHPSLHHDFGALLDDHGFTQLVDEPTRGKNVLDLVLSNNPTVVTDVAIIPGVSDHDCPLVTIDMKPTRRRQHRRKILLYSKADWQSFDGGMKAIDEEIASKLATSSVDDLWQIFKTGVEKGIEDFIPPKLTPKNDNLPWVTGSIRRLLK